MNQHQNQTPPLELQYPDVAQRVPIDQRLSREYPYPELAFNEKKWSVSDFCGITYEAADKEWQRGVSYLNVPLLFAKPNQNNSGVIIKRTFAAQERLKGITTVTPLVDVSELIGQPGLTALLKDETQQITGSFKTRGPWNYLSQLNQKELQYGVRAASAGNHAAGVAMAAFLLDISAHIVMPTTAPIVKINQVAEFGCKPELVGEYYSQAADYLDSFVYDGTSPLLVPPFDHPDIMTGNSTLAAEAWSKYPGKPKFHFMPAGGGGLAGGSAAFLKSIDPNCITIIVEPAGSDAMTHSMRNARLEELDSVDSFVDATAVRKVGKHTLEACMQYVNASVTVSNLEIAEATLDLHKFGIPVEAAGSLALAGARKLARHGRLRGDAVLYGTGGNIDPSKLQEMYELVHDRKQFVA